MATTLFQAIGICECGRSSVDTESRVRMDPDAAVRVRRAGAGQRHVITSARPSARSARSAIDAHICTHAPEGRFARPDSRP